VRDLPIGGLHRQGRAVLVPARLEQGGVPVALRWVHPVSRSFIARNGPKPTDPKESRAGAHKSRPGPPPDGKGMRRICAVCPRARTRTLVSAAAVAASHRSARRARPAPFGTRPLHRPVSMPTSSQRRRDDPNARLSGAFGRRFPKMSLLSFLGVDSQKGRPYNPPIAEAAARKRGDDRSKPLRNKSNFRSHGFDRRTSSKVENRVLTVRMVCLITRQR